MPTPQSTRIAALRRFVRSWLRDNLVPLSSSSDTSFDTWIEETPYPRWRKEELRKKWTAGPDMADPKFHRCKSFVKDETYPTYKYPRAINSRSDEFKCAVGPIFRLIEKKVFESPWFIKKVPIADRPQYIYDRMYRDGAMYMCTDYESFECGFSRELMDACEFELYDFMTRELQDGKAFMALIRRVLLGKNVCEFKEFVTEVRARRMSGEMCTSLGNGFTNLMITLFLCFELGTEAVGVVEGDDGLFSLSGEIFPRAADYESLGMKIKIEMVTELSEASFCGIVFSLEDKVNITDPIDVLSNFGWTSRQYLKSRSTKLLALLRCKSLSLAHQYPGCPVIRALADYGLRVTRSVDVRRLLESDRSMSMWEREQLLSALSDERKLRVNDRPVGMDSRLLMERKFGLTVEMQRIIENHLSCTNDVRPLRIPVLDLLIAEEQSQYYRDYVRDE